MKTRTCSRFDRSIATRRADNDWSRPLLNCSKALVSALTLVFALALAQFATPALADAPSVTDLSTVNVEIIESGDIVEALAVPRGTRIRPGNRPRVRLPVYFEFNSAELKPEARDLLVKVSDALTTEDLEAFNFSVEGHTDNFGKENYNQGLSRRRADAVKAFLASRGVESKRLQPIGRGEDMPVDSNDNEAGRQHNRRVEIINLGLES
jgi:outer membrane protein OmpA-like peptidoglycan-associated protein